MTNYKNVPALRFKEFEGKWETKSLGQVIEVISGIALKSYDISEQNKGIRILRGINITEGFIRHRKEIDRYYNGDSSKFEKYFVKTGDIVLGMDGSKVGKNVAVVTEEDNNSLLIQRVARIRNKPNSDNRLIFQILFSSMFRKYVDVVNTSSGIPHISLKQIKGYQIFLPKVEQQQKIANFLTATDTKIQQLRKKKGLLNDYKKGVMQQIFKQEVRFKNDDGGDFEDWEVKKLGEVCQVKRGASPRPISNPKWFDENSKVGWVRISDVTKSDKILERTTQYLSNKGIEKSRFVEKGNLIMSICATIGKPIYTGFDVCVHDGFVVFENLTLDKEFFFYYLQKVEKGWYRYGQPGIQLNLNSSIVTGEKISFPCMEEQQKIANFLSSIDERIGKVSEEIGEMERYKKGLLQGMFV